MCKEITSVPEFIKYIEDEKRKANEKNKSLSEGDKLGDFIFRGQPDDLPLLPSIARINHKINNIVEAERIIMEEFIRISRPFIEYQPDNLCNWLALAQHHGLPTRLLDWTYNALAAMWFAVKGPARSKSKSAKEYGVVWIFIPKTKYFTEKRDLSLKWDGKEELVPMIFRSLITTQRILSQSALFTLSYFHTDNKVMPLELILGSDELLKIIIPSCKFPEMRSFLDSCGINNASLFPDLDGLCAYLKWRFSYSEDDPEGNEETATGNR